MSELICKKLASVPHPPHSLKHPLFMTVHLCECSDLCQIYVLTVTESNNLIKCKYQVKHVVQYVLFIQRLTVLGNLQRKTNENNM